jgi:hypothetical protein
MTADEVVLPSAVNESVPVAVIGDRVCVAPGQAAEAAAIAVPMHICLIAQSPTGSPPQGVTAGQADPLLAAPALLPAPLELEPAAPFELAPACPFEPANPFELAPPPPIPRMTPAFAPAAPWPSDDVPPQAQARNANANAAFDPNIK